MESIIKVISPVFLGLILAACGLRSSPENIPITAPAALVRIPERGVETHPATPAPVNVIAVSNADKLIAFQNRLNNLIEQLGAQDWRKREAANKEIQDIVGYYINGISEDPEHLSTEMEYLVKALEYASEQGQPAGSPTGVSYDCPANRGQPLDAHAPPDLEIQWRALRLYTPVKYRLIVHRDLIKLYPDIIDILDIGEDDKVIIWLDKQSADIKNKGIPLCRYFLESSDDDIRASAIKSLEGMRDTTSLKQVLLLAGDDSVPVRQAVISYAAKSGAESVIKELIPLTKDKDEVVQANAVEGIFKLGGPLGITENSLTGTVLGALKDKRNWTRSEPLNLVIRWNDKSIIKDILPLLKDPDVRVRERAVIVVSELGGPAVAPDVLPLLDDCLGVRMWTLYALGRIQSPESVKSILPLLKDANEKVREFAVFALDRIGDIATVRNILPMTEDPEVLVRLRAIGALAKFGVLTDTQKQAFVNSILPLLHERNNRNREDVIEEAIRVIARLGLPVTVNELLPFLHHNWVDIRKEAIMAIGHLGEVNPLAVVSLPERGRGKEAAVKELLPLLEDQDKEVQAETIRTLGRIGNKSVGADLLPLLADDDEDVRLNAAMVLTQFGDKRAIPVWLDLIGRYGLSFISSYDDCVRYDWLKITMDEVRPAYEIAREGLEKLTDEAAAQSRLFRDKKMDTKDYREQSKFWKEWWQTEGKAWYEQEVKKIKSD